MNYKEDIQDNCWIIYLKDEIIDENIETLREQVLVALENKYDYLILNMADVAFINSEALGVLVSLYKEIHKNKSKYVLTELNKKVKKIFELTRLDQIMDIRDSNNDVINSV